MYEQRPRSTGTGIKRRIMVKRLCTKGARETYSERLSVVLLLFVFQVITNDAHGAGKDGKTCSQAGFSAGALAV